MYSIIQDICCARIYHDHRREKVSFWIQPIRPVLDGALATSWLGTHIVRTPSLLEHQKSHFDVSFLPKTTPSTRSPWEWGYISMDYVVCRTA
jgi:hypothetical protein